MSIFYKKVNLDQLHGFVLSNVLFFQLQKPFHKDDKGTVIFTKYFKAGSVSALKKQLDPH